MSSCDITSVDMVELAEAMMGRGALPHLERLALDPMSISITMVW